MARGINKVILVGNLGKDPEVRFTPNGDAVAIFTVATSETWKDQQGVQQERTEWHSIVVFRKLAEICGEYLKKGSKVYLEGKLQTSKWQDQTTGQDRYKTEIVVSEMQMLDSNPNAGGHNQQAAPQGNPNNQGGYQNNQSGYQNNQHNQGHSGNYSQSNSQANNQQTGGYGKNRG